MLYRVISNYKGPLLQSYNHNLSAIESQNVLRLVDVDYAEDTAQEAKVSGEV